MQLQLPLYEPIQNQATALQVRRPLAPGSYVVAAALDGFETAKAHVTVPVSGEGVVHNFTLWGRGVVAGSVVKAAESGKVQVGAECRYLDADRKHG